MKFSFYKKNLIKLLTIICSLLFSFIFLLFFYYKNNINITNIETTNTNFIHLIYVLIIYLFSLLTLSFRMFALINYKAKNKELFSVVGLSFALAFLLPGSGILFRITLLKKKFNYSILNSIENIITEKCIDLFSFFLLASISVYFLFYKKSKHFIYFNELIIGSFFIFILSFLTFKYYYHIIQIFIKIIKYFSTFLNHYFQGNILKKLTLLENIKNNSLTTKTFSTFITLTFLIRFIEIYLIKFFLKAFSINISYLESTFIFSMINLFVFLPISPSAIGLFQTGFILATTFIGIKTNMLLPAITLHLLYAVGNGLLFIFFFNFLKLKWKDIKQLTK